MSNQFKMMASNFTDADGFHLQFEESCPEADKKFNIKEFPKVDTIAMRKSHCTTCSVHIGTSPISEKIVRTHSILGVTQCVKCFAFYNSGEFGKGEDGSEYYCRWCGQGGEVFCCSTCPCVFCTKCIKTNLDAKYVRQIEKNDDWSCFICDKNILRKQRAEHWALRNFMIKQLEKIRKITVTSEDELNVLLNEDVSTCCPQRSKKKIMPTLPVNKKIPIPILPAPQKRRSETPPLPLSAAKKIAPNPSTLRPVKHNVYTYTGTGASTPGTPSPQPTRSAFINNSQKQTAVSNPSKKNDEIVCTPDLPGFFGAEETVVSPPQKVDPPPLAPMRTATPTLKNPTMMLNGTAVPIFHNVNGFQIDLNHAARQEVYRLPNGKLIQVRKTNPPTQVPRSYQPVRPSQPILRNLAPVNIPVNGNAIGFRRPQLGSGIRITPSMGIRPTIGRPNVHLPIPARFSVSNEGRFVATPSFTNPSAALAHSQISSIRSQSQPANKPVVAPPQSQSSMFTQQNGSISVARATYPKTQFGTARVEFEDRIISALEICQHTINKMITLTNSTSFKTANNFKDLKDLYTHLQYLFTYTTGKLTNFNDSLKTSIENLVKKDQSTKEKTDIDELQIVDQKVEVIDVHSDDEGDNEEHAKSNGDESARQQSPLRVLFPTINIHKKEISFINEEDMKNETVKEIVDNDKRLMTQVVVKMEKIEDSKNPVIQRLLKANRVRMQAMESEECSDDVVSDKDQTDDIVVPEIEIEKTLDEVQPDKVNDGNEIITESDNQGEKMVDNFEKEDAENETLQKDSETAEIAELEEVNKDNSEVTTMIDTVELSSDEEFEIETATPDKTVDLINNPLEDSNKENIDEHVSDVDIPCDKIDENSKQSTGEEGEQSPEAESLNMEIDSELPAELMDVDEDEFNTKEKDENNEENAENQKEGLKKVETPNNDILEPELEKVADDSVREDVSMSLDPISQDGSLDDILNSTESCEKIDLDGFLEGLNKITEGGDKSKSITPMSSSIVDI